MNRRVWYSTQSLGEWVSQGELSQYEEAAMAAQRRLHEGSGAGAEMLGWLSLPEKTEDTLLDEIQQVCDMLRKKSDVLICIGIGGSYLGAKAAIEFRSSAFDDQRVPRVVFAGHHLNSDYMADLLTLIKENEVAVNVISKSGTTTEPGVVFRIVRKAMEEKYGTEEAATRIVATTDPEKGALRSLSQQQGYTTFSIPGDVGGRFSVMTPVGLVPIAYAGIDIREMLAGAREAMQHCSQNTLEDNHAARYAAVRNILFRKGLTTEVMSTFQPQLHYIGEWWKQLAGESEGKNLTGIFPALVDNTTDLHSLGQWMQEGTRIAFETFIRLEKTATSVTVPRFEDNCDNMNYLHARTLEQINEKAYLGTLLAHKDGGVPVSTLTVADRTPASLGYLFYFYEKAIAVSGYILRINPFDQPGVEAYKKNMFALLEKPGFEEETKKLQNRI